MFDGISLFAAFIPVLIDGIKQGINYATGGPKPQSVEDLIKLRELDIRQFEALAQLDNAEGASRWVINIRSLQRPLVTFITLLYFGISMYHPVSADFAQTLSFLVQCSFFYLFGERSLMYVKGHNKR